MQIDTITKLQREWGPGWITTLRDTMNNASGKLHSTAAAAGGVGISGKTMERIIETLNIRKQHVYLLPGDKLVIERGGVQTVVNDRSAEAASE